MNVDGEAFAKAFQMNMSGDELMELLMSMGSSASTTYESNLQTLGYAEFDNPSGINIYPKDFTSKEHVIDILDAYNTRMENEGKSEQVISYTDVVGTLMSSVTDIVDIVSYCLLYTSVSGLPVKQVAYTGMDALTHAIEAYVSTLNGPFTDPLALQAIEMVLDYLPASYNCDMVAREQMHYAQCLAGMEMCIRDRL